MSDAEFEAAVSALDPELRVLLEGEAALDEEGGIASKDSDVQIINEEEEKKLDVCHRCYALKHYNHITTETSPAFLRATQQYGSLEFLKTKRNPLIVAVLDVIDLPFSLGSQLPELIRQNPSARIMIAANKFDMLPQRARRHEQRIRDWIVQHLKQHGFPTQQIRGVTLVSAKKGWGVLGLLRRIDEERLPTDDIYLVGCTNVGKSALLNQIMSQRASKSKRQQYQITSSAVPGTTMGTLRIPLHALHMGTPQQAGGKRRFLEREHYLIDTPGAVNDQQLIHLMSFKEQKKLMRHAELKPVTFRLEAGRSLLLDSFARIDVVESSDPVLFTLFTPMIPHITKTLKMMDQEGPLQPIPQLLSVRGVHNSRASVDLAFASIGWIAVAGMFDNARLRVWLPPNVNPVEAFAIRQPAMLPFEYQGVTRKFFGSGNRARQ
ncbi:hypothetical protein BDB00DRAFT_793088 [Zychaea mexicana]|uniref:uncharacterized protein n=1 Tax=Zychaea mexicana TaxID=64656 RepID=UPI0022FECD6B|nr:uncharacterized protein BDB00DRAFT_793088 [Zychaea mexicana]KAI9482508.1 hypothetical protein BDB00DRAFT_793088 [Zychaea mexicana]